MSGKPDLSAAPPFGLTDLRAAIPDECWEKDSKKSFAYLIKDVAIVLGLAVGAYALNQWCAFSVAASPVGSFVVLHGQLREEFHVCEARAAVNCMCRPIAPLAAVRAPHVQSGRCELFVAITAAQLSPGS